MPNTGAPLVHFINSLKKICEIVRKIENKFLKIDQEVPALQVHPLCANAHNFLGPTMGR